MLHGRILGSPYAHAIVKSVDASAAVAMGATVVTFADVLHAPTISAVLAFSSSGVDARDEPADSGVTTRPPKSCCARCGCN
jgi:CO/xanthine dehydrogenase Mo-binding subunit